MSEQILIVDDQSDLAGLMADVLSDAGYQTRVAENGRVALHEVQADPPDLLLLDAQMPEMDGFELASMLKTDPMTAAIPIIMVSAKRRPRRAPDRPGKRRRGLHDQAG